MSAVWGGLEEYTPLLARDTGVGLSTVPLLLLLVTLGQVAGGLLAPLGQRLGTGGYALLLAGSATALAGGALLAQWTGFLLLAAAFCGFQLASVLADARLQERIDGAARATVTSLAGLATDLTVIAVYAGYALVAGAAGNSVAFAVGAVPYLLVAVLLVVRRRVGVEVDPAPVVADEAAALGHRAGLAALPVVGPELDGAGGVEQPAGLGADDLQAGPALGRIEAQPGRPGGGMPTS